MRKLSNLYDEVGEIMDQISDSCNGAMSVSCERAAKWAVKQLKRFSTNISNRATGAYSKYWTFSKRGSLNFTIHNRKHYRLTHLLEKGHSIKHKGKIEGSARAIPHISNIEAVTADAVEQFLYEELNKKL